MNWIEELRDVYQKNEALAGQMTKRIVRGKKGEEISLPLVLLPAFHTTAAAQITVTVDGEGNFLDAQEVDDRNKLTLIPMTEQSASRTSKPVPHPLCDTLPYLAGDYIRFCRLEKSGKQKDYTQQHQDYLEALKDWRDSEDCHPKVDAVYRYLSRECLMSDLIRAGILTLGEDGLLMQDEKLQGLPQEKAFVRFKILSGSALPPQGDVNQDAAYYPECWLDRSLQQSYIRYYRRRLEQEEQGMSYLTGEWGPLAACHPGKIRNEGDMAKLMSGNDAHGFTFRGRFANYGQAVSIGYEDSQEVYSALKWLIRKQGYHWGDFCMVAWESNLHPLPDPRADTDAVCGAIELEDWPEENNPTEYWGTDEMGAQRLNRAMQGYGRRFGNTSRTVVLAFDSATKGRLAMTEQKVLSSSRYLDNIQYWHESCQWLHYKYRDKKRITYRGMVGIDELIRAVYGCEKGSKHYNVLLRTLLPCITDRRPIPVNVVNTAVYKASSPVSYSDPREWEQVLLIACSLVKKWRLERDQEVWNLTENIKKESEELVKQRDYLYGRLLAVADRIEYRTQKDSKRMTNAMRYMNAFSQRPYQTWKIIEEKIQPYLQQLGTGERIVYSKLLDEIQNSFAPKEFQSNKRLEGLYLLGYHKQSYAFTHKEQQNNNIQEEETHDGFKRKD